MENQSQSEMLAERMYHWYGDSADWKNFQGNPMPAWEELPADIRHHWSFVAYQFVGHGEDASERLLELAKRSLVTKRNRTSEASDGRRCSLAITKVEEALLWLKSKAVGVG